MMDMDLRARAVYARAPFYWRDETTGRLAYALRLLLEDQPMSPAEIGAVKLYLTQWINHPSWDRNPFHDADSRADLKALRAETEAMSTPQQLRACIDAAAHVFMDPL